MQVFTWLVLFFTFVLAYTSLEDITVVDFDDLDEEYRNINDDRRKRKILKKKNSDIDDDECDGDSVSKGHTTFEAVDVDGDGEIQMTSPIPVDYAPVEPMVGRRMLKRLFPNSSFYQSVRQEGEEVDEKYNSTDCEDSKMNESVMQTPPEYKMFKTQYRCTTACGGDGASTLFSPCSGIITLLTQFIFILRMRNTWKVLIFSFASVPVVLQWTANEMVLPPFLERHFGESIPIYTIQSIHMIGCLLLPPFVQAFTSSLEDFRVVMPGVRVSVLSLVQCMKTRVSSSVFECSNTISYGSWRYLLCVWRYSPIY
jgi:hypothetical protein